MSKSFCGLFINSATGCGETFSEPTGIITSPGYPGTYPDIVRCVYQIRLHGFNRITVTFTDFNLETSKDFLYFGQGFIAGEQMESLTGNLAGQLPQTRVFDSKAVSFLFTTDMNIARSGFRLEYSAGESGFMLCFLYIACCMSRKDGQR